MHKTTRNSFESVYHTIALPLMKFIVKKIGGDREAVEEVFSRTIVAAWKGWGAFEHKSTYFTWLCRIALNKTADYYREQIHRESVFVAPFLEDLANISIDELSPTERLAIDELRASIRACLKLLPEEKKQLLFMRYWKQLTIKQIALRFGVTERAVEGRLYRARQTLKELFESEYPDYSKAYLRKKE